MSQDNVRPFRCRAHRRQLSPHQTLAVLRAIRSLEHPEPPKPRRDWRWGSLLGSLFFLSLGLGGLLWFLFSQFYSGWGVR